MQYLWIYSEESLDPQCHTPESASSEATDNPLTMQLQYEVLFATRDVVAVKHARRREQFSFFLAVVMNYLLVKSTSATELEFAEESRFSLA